MTLASATSAGRHRRTCLVLPHPPDASEKYAYIQRNLFYLTTALVLSTTAMLFSQVAFEAHDAVPWPFTFFTLIFFLYQATSLPVNYTGRGFDLAAHDRRVHSWFPARYPDVDIHLPICGEPLDVLRNTWTAVAGLIAAYPGVARGYVLDDGADPGAAALAGEFGLTYWVRPNCGEFKKSGNLRYAFARTAGEFIVVLDADFAPRRDFLAETLPYLDDPAIAIVQTPQFFRCSTGQTWVERAAGAIQEVFYRSVQVARDRFGQAICVGTSAVYRRAALEPQGGPTLIPYAEDVHTGLDVRRAGWSMVYLPVVLSAGICPDKLDAFVRQQYRWCTGNAGVMFSRRLWSVPMGWPARLTYLSGFLYYAYTGLLTFFGPVLPILLLTLFPAEIRLRNLVLLLPAILTGFLVYPMWHKSRYGPAVWPLSIARGWAHIFAIWDGAWGRTMGWHPTRTPGSALWRFRLWVTCWSGGTAAAWAGLAVWRTVAADSPQFAVLLAFALVNLASVGRVIFPGKKAA